MSFDINVERTKLIKVVNNKLTVMPDIPHNISPIIFLLKVLKLTMKCPQVELYLKDLLNHFTIDELEKINCTNSKSILHSMTFDPYNISLGAFEMIINYGININIKNSEGRTATHLLLDYNQCNKHINSILDLLIKHGADLNIINVYENTVLDTLICYQDKLNEETQNCIMTLIDFGAITNNPKQNNIYNFIEYYKSSTIKPAMKNKI